VAWRDGIEALKAIYYLTKCIPLTHVRIEVVPFKFKRIPRLLRARVSARNAIGKPGGRLSWDSTSDWAIGGQRDTKQCASLCLAPSRAAILACSCETPKVIQQ
jgi:hypothetical protein